MAKKAVIDFANDPIEVIKAYLVKLKKEEARLETALTLRDFPTVENELVRLITCVVELSIIERSIRLESTQTNEDDMRAKQAQIQLQIDTMKAKLPTLINDNDATRKLREYYTGRIQALEISKYSAGMTRQNIKYLEHYERLLRALRKMYDSFVANSKFPESFDVFYHVVDLKKYLDIADDLIVQKGP